MLIVFLYLKIFSGSDTFYEKTFYEKTSGITIPRSSKVIESHDNGEFWTATSFQINKDSLSEFIQRFGFHTIAPNHYKPTMFAESVFKVERIKNDSKIYLYNFGTKGKNSWMYVLDQEKSILWAEIQYPDWSGD